MEKNVLRAGEREAGGGNVISSRPSTHVSSARESAVPAIPIPGLKKDRCKNPIASRKKRQFQSTYTSTVGNGSSGRKNSSNTDEARFRPSWRNTSRNAFENGGAVTTTHLFWPNQRRRTILSLRNWQPKSDLTLPAMATRRARRGGGGQSDAASQTAVSIMWLRKFTAMGLLPKHHEYSNN
jgi:hypothetical protein